MPEKKALFPEEKKVEQTPSSSQPKVFSQIQNLIDEIKQLPLEKIGELPIFLEQLLALFDSERKNAEFFYQLMDGFSELIHKAEEDFDPDFFINLLEILLEFLEEFQDNNNFLMAIDDPIILILETFVRNEAFEILEEYVIYLVNKAIENLDNNIIRSIASEATIVAIKGFGEDWNVEKAKEFDIILRGLLPPLEVSGFLATLLLKGLAIEIENYGDMHETNSMKRSLKIMRELHTRLQKCIDDDFTLYYSKGLISAIHWFGELEEFDEMMVTLNELLEIVEKHADNSELKILVADGFRLALDYCGAINDLPSILILVNQLLKLADESPTIKKIQSMAIMGVNQAALWLCSFRNFGLTINLLYRVNEILARFPEERSFKLLATRGLFNITKELTSTTNVKLMLKVIEQIEEFYLQNQTVVEIARYFAQALVNVIYLLGEISDEEELINIYLSKAESLAERFDIEEGIVVSYSQCLVNAVRFYGLQAKIPEMEVLLSRFEDFETSAENIEITLRLGKAYVDAIKVYGDIGDLEKVTRLYINLKEWLYEDQYNLDLQILFAKALVNIVSAFGKNDRANEMNLYLDELREITLLFPSLTVVQEQLVKGLAHSIRLEVNHSNLNRCISMLNEMRSLCGPLEQEESVQEVLARSTRRVLVLAYKQNKFELVEELLEALRKLLKALPKNETIQIELARALTNIIIEESNLMRSTYLNSLAVELKGLTIQYPENKKLLAIHETIAPLLKE
ncbi:MAG: hypothetical protein K9W42_07210 [Candidatus Heimdallarchaeota archaeon]|nr:hypothetical protein [Candidatus Heimdallarchaeota archaeon]